jgi:hypothetical protein
VRFDPPAEIVKVRRRAAASPAPPEYHNVWILHGGASVDDRRSGAIRPRGICGHCRQAIDAIRKVVLADGSWNGADIFTAYGLLGETIVTARFKEFVERHGLTNAEFVPLEDFRFDYGVRFKDDDPARPSVP